VKKASRHPYKYIVKPQLKDSFESLVDFAGNRQIGAFMVESVPSESRFRDMWVNYLYSGILFTESDILTDVWRSVSTIRLLSETNKDLMWTNGFGAQQDSVKNQLGGFAVVVTGELTKILSERELLVTLLDGLQLSGHFDLFTCKDKKMFTFGDSYFKGLNSEDITLMSKDIVPVAQKIVIPELPSRRSGRNVVLTGRYSELVKGASEPTEIYAIEPSIEEIELPAGEILLELNFVKGAYLKDLGTRIECNLNFDSIVYDKIIFDCRHKPIIYGVNARDNKLRMAEWFYE